MSVHLLQITLHGQCCHKFRIYTNAFHLNLQTGLEASGTEQSELKGVPALASCRVRVVWEDSNYEASVVRQQVRAKQASPLMVATLSMLSTLTFAAAILCMLCHGRIKYHQLLVGEIHHSSICFPNFVFALLRHHVLCLLLQEENLPTPEELAHRDSCGMYSAAQPFWAKVTDVHYLTSDRSEDRKVLHDPPLLRECFRLKRAAKAHACS